MASPLVISMKKFPELYEEFRARAKAEGLPISTWARRELAKVITAKPE